MAKRNTSKPKYQRQRRKAGDDLAFVELNRRRIYLGKFGTPESRSEYRRVAGRPWSANGLQRHDHRRGVDRPVLGIRASTLPAS